jgi:hypothetical protein
MDVKQRYTRETDEYKVEDDFIESIQRFDIRTGIKIANYINQKSLYIPESTLVSTIMGGLVINDDNEPVTFAVEIIKDFSPKIKLTDLKPVSMDEYLDLYNLNLKLNGSLKSKSS